MHLLPRQFRDTMYLKRNIYNFSARLEYIRYFGSIIQFGLMPVFLSMYIWGICEHEEENDEEKWLFYPCTSSTGKGSTELERKGIINTTF